MDNQEEVLMYAVGDIYADRPFPETIFSNVSHVLRSSDIAFCQLESPLSHTTVPSAPERDKAHDSGVVAAAIRKAGFNIVSFASNHCMEGGLGAFLETIDSLRSAGCHVIGCGRDIMEARKPALIASKGNTIAILAYNSVGVPESWAENNKPGCAPLRVWTFYEPMVPTQPGTPVRIHTFPYRTDAALMIADIEKAKAQADVVIVSMHSGVRIMPTVVAEYQIDIAHAAIDAGADLVVQHHAHILKGIDVYRGKVIFYGLGNFALEVHFMTKEWASRPEIKEEMKAFNPDWHPPYADYPSYPFPPDSRKTVVAKFVISKGSISRVSFLPAMINGQSQPEIISSTDKQFGQVLEYIATISQEAGFHPIFKVDGDEVIVAT